MPQETYLGLGTRLRSEPAAALAESAFAFELGAAPYLLRGLSLADMAHVMMLAEGGIVAEEDARALVCRLLELHEETSTSLVLDPRFGDIYNNRQVVLRDKLGTSAGMIHTGRARREATTIAWQLALRERLHEARATLCDALDSILGVIKAHRRTHMPDFTYLLHAHPTTLAHYLLGYAYPLVRDLRRLARAFELVNRSPAGSGSVNGSRLAMNRKYIADLLGFDGMVTHTRDAMWAPDMATECMSAVLTTITNLDRLAEELQLWSTPEFGYVSLFDGHCRTSVIMPHKKNPYGVAFVRGLARDLLGAWTSVAATNLSPSGQPDNRIFAYERVPASLDALIRAIALMGETVAKARFDRTRMNAAAASGFACSTELCDLLVETGEIDNRSAHKVVGRAVRAALERGDEDIRCNDLIEAAGELSIELPPVDEAMIARSRDIPAMIAARQGIGGAGDEPMDDMISDLEETISGHRSALEYDGISRFEQNFLERVESFLAEG